MYVKYRHQLPELMIELGLPMVAAELGVAEGYNSADLLKAGIQKLYCIDVWETHSERFGDVSMSQEWHDKNYEDAMTRLRMFPKERYTVLRGFTVEMTKQIADNSLGLGYLDAGHDEESVKADLKAIFPKVVSGGIIAGHDYLNEGYGVKRAVEEFCAGRFEIHVIPENNDPANASFYFIKK